MWSLKRIVLLGTAILALSFYYWYSGFRAREKSSENLASKKILSLDGGDEVGSILLEWKDRSTIGLVREGARWWVSQPRRYPADDLIVDGLVSALTATTWERMFERSEIQLQDMGLEAPAQRVSMDLSSQGASPRKSLLIGQEAPAGQYVYVMWEDGSRVFMVHNQFARAFDKSLYSLRKKRVFDLASDQIYAVDVALQEKSFTLVKWNNRWWAVNGESFRADPAAVEGYVSDLAGLYVKDFLDDLNPKNPDLGLHPAKFAITLTDFAGSSYTVRIGKENKEREAFYGLKEGEDVALLLPSYRLQEMPAGVDFFRKKRRLGKLYPEKMERLELKRDETILKLVKVGDQWKFESGKEKSPEDLNATIQELVEYLREVKVERSIEGKKPEPAPRGLWIRWSSSDRKKPKEYVFYREGDRILAQSATGINRYEVDSDVWAELNRYFQKLARFSQS